MGRAFWPFPRVAVRRRCRQQIGHVGHIGVVSIGVVHIVFAVVGMLEFVEGCFYVAGHGYADCAIRVVPFESQTEVFGPCHVDGY